MSSTFKLGDKKSAQKLESESSTTKDQKSISEIDELFDTLKKKKKVRDETAIDAGKEKKKSKLKEDIGDSRVRVKKSQNSLETASVNIVNPEAPIHRWDQESGLPVYKYTALKVGDGGGTSLCPFDCNCCF